MSTKPRVGFIGVGLMGHGMAKNILESGYELTIMGHKNRKPVTDLVKTRCEGSQDCRCTGQGKRCHIDLRIVVRAGRRTGSRQVRHCSRRCQGGHRGGHVDL